MKAVVIEEFGNSEVLKIKDVEKPKPKADEVLVRIQAFGVNPVDVKVRQGTNKVAKTLSLPAILGFDAAGIVEETGDQVTEFKVGDQVFGCFGFPTVGAVNAEFAVVKTSRLARKPSDVSFEEAAALPIVGLTAYQTLVEYLEIKSGQRILIQAASGGVGHLAVQLAKEMGAYVYATCSEKNRDFVKSLGADRVIDYKKEDFTKIAQNLDAVQDAMGGEVLYRSMGCVHPGGRVACLPSSTSNDPKALELAEKQDVKMIWPYMRADTAQLEFLIDLMAQGKLKIHLDEIFPFDKTAEAYQRVESHHAVGKVVVRV